jgi:hypothetical protein
LSFSETRSTSTNKSNSILLQLNIESRIDTSCPMPPLDPVATFPLNEEDIFARVFLPRLKVHLRRRNILSQKRDPLARAPDQALEF